MMYDRRVCACGCGGEFWPRRLDQRFRSPWCRAAAWRATHSDVERRSERFAPALRTNPTGGGEETFSEGLSRG